MGRVYQKVTRTTIKRKTNGKSKSKRFKTRIRRKK